MDDTTPEVSQPDVPRRMRPSPVRREGRLVVLEGLAWVMPFGFVLAACYLVSGRDRASNLALISIPFNIALWVFIFGAAVLAGMPNCRRLTSGAPPSIRNSTFPERKV